MPVYLTKHKRAGTQSVNCQAQIACPQFTESVCASECLGCCEIM
jgi:hypothetical protein